MRRSSAVAALLASLVLLVPAAMVRGSGPSPSGAAASWQEGLFIDSQLAQPQKMFEAFDTASLNLYDFNGDGQLEIVSNNDNNRAYVIDSKTGGVLAEIPTDHPGGETWPVRDINPIAVGDLMGDGTPCMVVPSDAARMDAWCFDAADSTPTHFAFTKEWNVTLDAGKYEPTFKQDHPWMYDANGTLLPQYELGSDGEVFMANVDGSGCKYVFAETDGYPGQLAFDCHGNYKWSHSWYDGNAGAVVADLNGDGKKEAIFASDAGDVATYDAKTGAVEWSFHARDHGAYPGSIPVAPTLADVYGTGKLYTFFGARNAVQNKSDPQADPLYEGTSNYPADPNWMNETHEVWYLLAPNGQMMWNVSYDWMNPLSYNHAAAIDVNGDGVLDFVCLDWNTIGHKPGDWETTNRSSNLFVLDGRDGSVIWRTSVPIYWSNKDFVIADVTGDGKQDVVVDEPKYGVDGVGVFDLSTGKETGWFPVQWGETRGPVAGDLYGDGKLELVVPVATGAPGTNYRSLDVGWRQGALEVLDTGSAYKAAFSANFWLTDDQKMVSHGTVGKAPTPPSSSPPPVTSTPVTTNPTASTQPTTTTLAGHTTTTTGTTTPPTESANLSPAAHGIPTVTLALVLPALAAAAMLLRTRKR
jgi:hypothetical protein